MDKKDEWQGPRVPSHYPLAWFVLLDGVRCMLSSDGRAFLAHPNYPPLVVNLSNGDATELTASPTPQDKR